MFRYHFISYADAVDFALRIYKKPRKKTYA